MSSLVKKYLYSENQKIFVGYIIGTSLEQISYYIKDAVEDSEIFYSFIFNTKLVNNILHAFTDVTNTLDSLAEKY